MKNTKMKAAGTNYPFLSGGGEMGELMRLKDWSTTLLGDPSTWPQSLRITLGILLNSRFPMFLFWGPELICFYNDAYRPSLGKEGKHPGILGSRGEDYWPEIWDAIKPLIDSVLEKGEGTWSEDQLLPIYRNGQMEDVYWTFSYSPVNDESGKAVGVFVTCSETTDKVKAYKKLEQSELRFRNTVEHAPIGITILRGTEFMVEMANETYLQLVDRKEKDFVGKPLFDALPEVKILVDPLLKDVMTTGNPYYGFEFTIPIFRFGKKETAYFNFVYYPLREDNGDISGIIVVASEVTSTVKAKHSLAESEKQFRSLVMQSPIPMAIIRGRDHIIEIANKVMFQNIWRKKQEEVIGRSILQVFPELNDQKYPALLHEVFTTGKIHRENESVAFVEGDDGMRKFYLDFEYAPLYETDETISGIIITVNDVTEKVEARINIEESEKEFRQLADSLPELVWTTDNKGKQTFASGRWKEFTGLDPYDEASFKEMMHPDDVDALMKTWLDCLATGKIYKAQTRLRKTNGEYQWFYVNGEPIKNEQGDIEKWIGAFTNFNDQKKAEEKLIQAIRKIEDSESRLNIVIEASELGTWELNVKTGAVIYSDRYIEILGYASSTVLTHQQIVNHLHPDDLKIREEAFKQAYITGFLHYESRLIWNDGSIHWIEGKGKVFYDEQNHPSIMIGTSRDITEEKNYQQKLEEREQKFRLLADTMPELVWTGDTEGNFNYFNESVYKYSGLNPEQIGNDGWLQMVHPDDREENIRAWAESISSGRDFLFEHRFRKHDGEYRWQLSRAVAQRDAGGQIEMWVGISTDIQDMKELDQQKDFFISMASHELKTPITSIKGYVQMLQSIHKNGDDNFLKNSLRVIDKQIGTLTNLISDLLDLSKIKSGSLVLNKEFFPMDELTEEIINEIKHINPDYEFIFLPSADKPVYADRERIGQVLKNFLTNAVKYSPTARKITIATIAEDNIITVSVSDWGIGISKKDQLKIFERFYRVEGKSEKTFPGFGIGLFISSEIVQRHNGSIGVDSEPGKGSVFHFSIPVGKNA